MEPGESKAPETLAERFWSLARGMEGLSDSIEPVAVVEHVLAVLDALEAGKVGDDLSASTINFLTLLRHYEVKGDLLYASPEQARGEQVDERSLVFSVGVLLFEKLTGRHPFGAEGNPQRLARMQRGEMASGVNYFPRVPTELRVVLVRAMGPFPEERWNSLADLRAQLDRYLARCRHADPGGPPLLTTRPLPALPGGAPPPPLPHRRVTAPPRITAPSIDLSRMASVSGRLSAIDTGGDAAPISEAPVPRRRRKPLPPGAWAFGGVIVGVAATSLVFLAAWPGEPATTAPAPVIQSAAGPRTSGLGPQVEPSNRDPNPNPNPNPNSNPNPNPDPGPTATPAAKPAASARFDPTAGGQAALLAVRTCLTADRTAQFGASLLYDRSGLSRRVYFGADKQLHPPERDCLEKKLLDLPAGAPPEKPVIVTYSFHLAPAGDHVKARSRR